MRGRRHKLAVSTFPFLAVLLCAMGSLILILLVMDRKAHQAAQARAQREAARLAEESAHQSATLRAEVEKKRQEASAAWEQKREALHANLSREQVEMQLEMRKLREQLGSIAARLRYEQDTSTDLRHKIDTERGRIKAEEQLLDSLRTTANQTGEKSKESSKALQRMTADLLQMEQALRDLREARKREQHTFSVVPYHGRRGESRRPLYVECASDEVIFHPERRVMPVTSRRFLVGQDRMANTPDDVHAEVERRIARQRAKDPADANKTPYLLLLVRPDGIATYCQLQAVLKDMTLDFGYEFIDADWVLDFPADDEQPSAQPWMTAARTPVAPNAPAASKDRPRPAGLAPAQTQTSSTSSGAVVQGIRTGASPGSGQWLRGSAGQPSGGGATAQGSGPFAAGPGAGASGPFLPGGVAGGVGSSSPTGVRFLGSGVGGSGGGSGGNPLEGTPELAIGAMANQGAQPGGSGGTPGAAAGGPVPPGAVSAGGEGTGTGRGGSGAFAGRGSGHGHPAALAPALGGGDGTGTVEGEGTGEGGYVLQGMGRTNGGSSVPGAAGHSRPDGPGLGRPRALASTSAGNGSSGSGTSGTGTPGDGAPGSGAPGSGGTGTGGSRGPFPGNGIAGNAVSGNPSLSRATPGTGAPGPGGSGPGVAGPGGAVGPGGSPSGRYAVARGNDGEATGQPGGSPGGSTVPPGGAYPGASTAVGAGAPGGSLPGTAKQIPAGSANGTAQPGATGGTGQPGGAGAAAGAPGAGVAGPPGARGGAPGEGGAFAAVDPLMPQPAPGSRAARGAEEPTGTPPAERSPDETSPGPTRRRLLPAGNGGGERGDPGAPPPRFATPSMAREPRRPAPAALRPAWVHGGRDWTIYVECRPDVVVLYPSERAFTVAEAASDGSVNPLVAAIRQMIDRRQSARRPGEPPFYPKVCLLVRPENPRTFLTVYPALEALPVPKARQNLDPEDDVRDIVRGVNP